MQRTSKVVNKKRLVRYKEGAEMYSVGMNKFQTLAKDAGAILKIDRIVLVDLDVLDQYLESFRVKWVAFHNRKELVRKKSIDFWLNKKYNQMWNGWRCRLWQKQVDLS